MAYGDEWYHTIDSSSVGIRDVNVALGMWVWLVEIMDHHQNSQLQLLRIIDVGVALGDVGVACGLMEY